MNMTDRFRQQYIANLQEYRRQSPWRFLRLLIAFVLAIVIGGLLHLVKNIPLLFYPLVAVLGMIAVALFVSRFVGLFRRTYHETQFIVNGENRDEPTGSSPANPFQNSSYDPNFVAPGANPPSSQTGLPQPKGGGKGWLVALGVLAFILFIGCLGVPALLFVTARNFKNPLPAQIPGPVAKPMQPEQPFANPGQARAQRIEEQKRLQQERIQKQEEKLRRQAEKQP